MSQVQVIDQTEYPNFVEYVIRLDGDSSTDFRVQADGTLADLTSKVSAKIQEMVTPPVASEIKNGDLINLSLQDLQNIQIIESKSSLIQTSPPIQGAI